MHIGTRSAIVFPIVLLILLALLTFWINRAVQPPTPKLDGSSRHDPDYIMSNFVTTQTDVNGDLRYKLAAIEMRHFPDDDTTVLQKPRDTQFAVGKPYTQVEGMRGYVSSNGEEVELVDNVKVTRQAFEGKGEMTMDTDYLNIHPDQEFATTESPVVIRQAPKTVIYATGMIYEKKTRTVTLLHKVRAHYEKPTTAISAAKPAGTNIDSKAKVSAGQAATSEKTPVPKQANFNQDKLTQDKSNINNARIRRRYE